MHKLLENIGLSPLEAIIYLYISENGPSSAGRTSRQTHIQRSMCYVVLNSLIDKDLIYRDNKKKVIRFSMTNPEKLNELVQAYTVTAKLAENAYQSVIEQLKQQFAIQSGQPGVRFYTGEEGLRQLYRSINNSGVKEILLVRASTRPESSMLTIISEQVAQQHATGIAVRVINSSTDADLGKYINLDATRHTERRIIPTEVFKNPSQMIIFGNKVGFTTYHDPMMTVVIEHQDIATTIRSIYEYVWRQSETDTKYYFASKKAK